MKADLVIAANNRPEIEAYAAVAGADATENTCEINALKASLSESTRRSTLLQEEVMGYMAKFDPEVYFEKTSESMVVAGEMTNVKRAELLKDFDRRAEETSEQNAETDVTKSRATYMRLASHRTSLP
jgi:hypothetical protein